MNVDRVTCNPSWTSAFRILLANMRLSSDEATWDECAAELIRAAGILDRMLLEHTDYFDLIPVSKQIDWIEEIQ